LLVVDVIVIVEKKLSWDVYIHMRRSHAYLEKLMVEKLGDE